MTLRDELNFIVQAVDMKVLEEQGWTKEDLKKTANRIDDVLKESEDNYEKLLQEKIANAEIEVSRHRVKDNFNSYTDNLGLSRLYGEIEAYTDALIEYRRYKNDKQKED